MRRRQKPTMRRLETFVVVFVGAVVAVAAFAVWGSVASSEVTEVEPRDAPAAVATSAAPSDAPAEDVSNGGFVGAPAPDFSLTLFDTGETVTLSGLQGRPVIVDFFASWCPSCRAEAPFLQSFWEIYQDRGIVLLGVALNDSVEGLQDFKRVFDLTYPMGLDETGEIAARYRVGSIPTFVMIDREGRIANVVVGAMGDDAMAAEAEALLK